MKGGRRWKATRPLAERLDAARRKAKALEARRCPACGALCRWDKGNVGARASCPCGNG